MIKMAQNETNKKLLYGGLTALFLLFAAWAILFNGQEPVPEYEFPAPAEVVRQYFDSWGKKDYPNTYAAFSDGFKRIEPTAQNLQSFREYAQSQQIAGVNMLEVEEKSNDGITATVDYSVEFVLNDGSSKPFEGTFTLKYREGDIIRGWKLIRPYGENADRS